ncbi:MAG TPA: heterodisulfide reductase-related iron-sulfur binding cluster, partial [Tepidisphaeraceae bacterium]|nr:heterodisulfide reductase-related iron-sulfur binding cluster [Tepidisphaeraceae bacterium]
RLRPRYAYAFGWIHIWARLAQFAPGIVNFFTHAPGLSMVAKWLAGIDQNRRAPEFAAVPFKTWFKRHKPKHPSGPPVLLFADTFNNYFHVETAKAAVEVLEDAGFRVEVPMQDICCGRPLYDYGFLNMAKRWLQDILQKLQPAIEAGIPMVVLEPSCWAVFKDELTNMLPNDLDAKRLQNLTMTLAEFLRNKAPHYKPPKFHRKILLHGHCHQKSIDKLNDKEHGELFAERHVLKAMGVEIENPESGCCGMAGSFGFEPGDHYNVAVAAGERVLLPKVREIDKNTPIVADGFSCRTQISESTDRHALHLAQLIQYAKRGSNQTPERQLVKERTNQSRLAYAKAAAMVAGIAIGFWAFSRAKKQRSRV